MASKNVPSSYRLSTEALRILAALSEKLGISRAAVIELAVRKFKKQQDG